MNQYDPARDIHDLGEDPAALMLTAGAIPAKLPSHIKYFGTIVHLDLTFTPASYKGGSTSGPDLYWFAGLGQKWGLSAQAWSKLAAACGVETKVVGIAPIGEAETLVRYLGRDEDLARFGRKVLVEGRVLDSTGLFRQETEEVSWSAVEAFQDALRRKYKKAMEKTQVWDYDAAAEETVMEVIGKADAQRRGIITKAKNRVIRRLLGWPAAVDQARIKASGGRVYCVRFEYDMGDPALRAEAFRARLGLPFMPSHSAAPALGRGSAAPELPQATPDDPEVAEGEWEPVAEEAVPDAPVHTPEPTEEEIMAAEAAARAADAAQEAAEPQGQPAAGGGEGFDVCEKCGTALTERGQKLAKTNLDVSGGWYCGKCLSEVMAEKRNAQGVPA